MNNNKNVWFAGCMFDRWQRIKHKVIEPSFFFSRILPYDMQEWIDDSYSIFLPHGCYFGYTNKGYIQSINIPRKYDIDAVYKKFLKDVLEQCEKNYLYRLQQGII